MKAVENALRRLSTDHIDIFQLHAFDAATPVEEVLSTLDMLVRAGKIRYVGVSNFSGWQIMKSLAVAERHGWPRYVVNQVYYSLSGVIMSGISCLSAGSGPWCNGLVAARLGTADWENPARRPLPEKVGCMKLRALGHRLTMNCFIALLRLSTQ